MRLDRLGKSTNVLVTKDGNPFEIRVGNPRLQIQNLAAVPASRVTATRTSESAFYIWQLTVPCILVSIFRGLKRPVRQATHIHLKSRFRVHGHYSVMRRPGENGLKS